MEADRYLYTCYPLIWSILSEHNTTEDSGKDYEGTLERVVDG